MNKLTNDHKVQVLDHFSHVDFYQKPDTVKLSADAVAEFFKKKLILSRKMIGIGNILKK